MSAHPIGCLITLALEEREEISKNAREGGRQHADHEEEGVSRLKLVALVPAGKEVCRA